MAKIELRSGKYRVVIRKKGKEMSATFSDKITAETWARYQEDLIDNMENFNVPPEGLVTLLQCFELKIKSLKEKQTDGKTFSDFNVVIKDFKEIMNTPLNELTSDMIRNISKDMLGSIVKRGGSSNPNSGVLSQCSPSTVLRKLRLIASVLSFMIENGANIKNVAQTVVNQVKMSIDKSKNNEEGLE